MGEEGKGGREGKDMDSTFAIRGIPFECPVLLGMPSTETQASAAIARWDQREKKKRKKKKRNAPARSCIALCPQNQ